jgi:serralysin
VFRQGNHAGGAAGQAAWSWNQAGTANKHVDVMVDKNYAANPAVGTDAYLCVLHEIGHALGLAHAGNYNGNGAQGGNTYMDNQDVSAMSYFNGKYVMRNSATAPAVTGPQLYDIAAIQSIYGANTSFNAGNTTYNLTGAKESYAIWDGGGNDTLSAANLTTACRLDLREGQLNVNLVGSSALWVAFNANIENATGGSGNDTIYGNSLANILTGGAGNDSIYAGVGLDVITGGVGADTIYVVNGNGNDRITDCEVTDRLLINNVGITGNATISGSGYVLAAGGQNFNLSLSGTTLSVKYNNGTETLTLENFQNGDMGINLGGKSAPAPTPTPTPTPAPAPSTPAPTATINGTAGADTIFGTTGRDVIYAKAGSDVIYGRGGNDIIFGEDGNDVIIVNSGNCSLVGGTGNDHIYGGWGNDTLLGGDGIDILMAGAGNDVLDGGAGQDFFIYSGFGFGSDIIRGFLRGVDKIDVAENISNLVSRITYDSDSAMVRLADGSVIDLLGITQLSASDFI